MNYIEIAMLPSDYNDVHESVFRSYHIVEKVKGLLERKTPPDVILELINMMELNQPQERTAQHLRKKSVSGENLSNINLNELFEDTKA
jgi:hypothetical protein